MSVCVCGVSISLSCSVFRYLSAESNSVVHSVRPSSQHGCQNRKLSRAAGVQFCSCFLTRIF